MRKWCLNLQTLCAHYIIRIMFCVSVVYSPCQTDVHCICMVMVQYHLNNVSLCQCSSHPCGRQTTSVKELYRQVWFMMFNTTFNNISVISWWSVLLVEETGVPGENHRPVVSHWQTLSHNVVLSTPRHERSSNSQF